MVNRKGDVTRDEARWGPSLGAVGGECTCGKTDLIRMMRITYFWYDMFSIDSILLVYVVLGSWETFFYTILERTSGIARIIIYK